MNVIGIVGKQNGGKDALADYLCREHGFEKLSTGDLVRDRAEREGTARTRSNLQNVAADLIVRQGEDYIARVLLKEIEQHDWDCVAITGLRTPTDVKTLRDRLGDAFTLVRVRVGNPQTRFNRAKARGNPRDAGTYAQFLAQDKAEDDRFDLNRTLEMADITIPNDGAIEEFYAAIEQQLVRALRKED